MNDAAEKVSSFVKAHCADSKHISSEITKISMETFVIKALEWKKEIFDYLTQVAFNSSLKIESKKKQDNTLENQKVNFEKSSTFPLLQLKEFIDEPFLYNKIYLYLQSDNDIDHILLWGFFYVKLKYIRNYLDYLSKLLDTLENFINNNNLECIEIEEKLQKLEEANLLIKTPDKDVRKSSNFIKINKIPSYLELECSKTDNFSETQIHYTEKEMNSSAITLYVCEEDNLLRDKHGHLVLDDLNENILIETPFKKYMEQISKI